MDTHKARQKAARERIARRSQLAAWTHERALLLELWAAELLERSGEVQAARHHRAAAEREATYVEDYYSRPSPGS